MRRGFTLMEVLMAMGIFLVGMLAVLALFPSAALVQKRTVDDVNAEQVARSATALLSARNMREADLEPTLPADFDTSGKVVMLDQDTNKVGDWTLIDRSYPSTSYIDEDGTIHASMYWVPLIQDRDPDPDQHEWQMFAFILSGGAQNGYPRGGFPQDDWVNYDDNFVPGAAGVPDRWFTPGVVKVPVNVPAGQVDRFEFDNSDRIVNVADWILDEYGITYQVLDVDDTGIQIDGFIVLSEGEPAHIFLSPGGVGVESPCRRIVIIPGGVTSGP